MPLLFLLASILAFAVSVTAQELTGAEIYREACASCHGPDGRGDVTGTAIRVPLPDLTDCSFNRREPNSDWAVVVAHGGPAMGLSDQMPSFAGALEAEQIERALDHVRGFCTDDRWPRGELNFRRLLFTSKAFPENEAVIEQRFTKGPGGPESWETRLQIERRLGPRGQAELSLPIVVRRGPDEPNDAGVGDLALSYKHVLYASLARSVIASASLEVGLPTGDEDSGLGDGTVKIEPSLHGGAAFAPFVLQGQIQGLAPLDEERADRGVRYRLGVSYPLGPLRRDWIPSLEFETLQNVTRKDESFFLTPQIYKAIRKRGHVALALGVQIPVAGSEPFDYRIVGFLLWEYLDGGLWW